MSMYSDISTNMPPNETTPDGQSYMDHRELLIRIDERTKHFTNVIDSFKEQMVTQGEFKPVRMIAYGMTGIMGSAVILAIIGTVVNAAK